MRSVTLLMRLCVCEVGRTPHWLPMCSEFKEKWAESCMNQSPKACAFGFLLCDRFL
ncbi:hypothetical protein Hanom_Chr11g01037941 [Helianthus anomalus]